MYLQFSCIIESDLDKMCRICWVSDLKRQVFHLWNTSTFQACYLSSGPPTAKYLKMTSLTLVAFPSICMCYHDAKQQFDSIMLASICMTCHNIMRQYIIWIISTGLGNSSMIYCLRQITKYLMIIWACMYVRFVAIYSLFWTKY